jgi:pectate lyase C
MKKKSIITLILSLVIVISTFTFFMVTTNAASSTHEAEDDANKFKYASVNGDYVEFDATKDAYVEMKSVNSPASGTATLTFVYSKSSSGTVPVEVKVNGTTVVSKESFSSTGGSWAEKSIEASMESGSDNKIRFKLRAAAEGVCLDKVIISTDGGSSSDDDSDSDDSDNNDDDDSDSSDNTASYTIDDEGTIVVHSGTFNGGGKSYGSDIGDGSQDEDQPAVFELEEGADLTNCVIVPPAGDGIHVEGNNEISDVEFTDVGEDAISMRSSAEGGTVKITDCSFAKGEDKIFQVNKESTWYLTDIEVDGAGKVMRQNGGKTFPLTVYIDGLKATDIDEAIVRSDSEDCTVYYRDITCNLDKSDWWYGDLTAISY